MAYQLIYTSYPRSLVMGRTGFSTVARSRNMPEKLAAAVERCGVYDIGSGEVFSHRIIFYAGEDWHVLTRMKDSGVDYTNRNNYIAHHLVIRNAEVASLANPAEILAQWSGWISKWKREPEFIEDVVNLEDIKPINTLPAKTWKEYFGSPSKAALLFKESLYISASPQNARVLLNLFSEVCMLSIDPIEAWANTFTTSFSKGENPSDFMWKASNSAENALINLSARLAPSVPDSRVAQYATTGELNNIERLNLKVKAPIVSKKFKVAQPSQPQDSHKILYISSVVLSLIIIAIGVLWASIPVDDESSTFESVESASLPVLQVNSAEVKNETQANEVQRELSLVETMGLAREKIEKDEYEDAIKIWDSSKFAPTNPSLREDLLADIGARIDSLFRAIESEISLGTKSNIAIENLEKTRRALNINGIPRKERRAAKWESLNDKIKK